MGVKQSVGARWGTRVACVVAVCALVGDVWAAVPEGSAAGALSGAMLGVASGAYEAEAPAPEGARNALEEDLFGGADDERTMLEEDMFGGPEEERGGLEDAMFRDDSPIEESGAGPATRDDAVLGAGDTYAKQASLMDRLDEDYDKLAVGGMLYSRAVYRHAEGDSLASAVFSAPTLFDVYFDGRPNDRVRAFARGRLTHEATGATQNPLGVEVDGAAAPAQTKVALDQLWLKFDIEQLVFITVGRQPMRWGSGRFWNPSDVLNAQARDPLAVFDERLGVDLIKAHASFESIDANLYAVANLSGASDLSRVGGAFRAEWLLGLTELALTAAVRKDDAERFAADISTGIWLFDVRCELGLVHDDPTPRWEGNFDPETLDNPLTAVLPREASQEPWHAQVVAGIETTVRYSDQDNVIFGLEYTYNQAGYDDAELLPWVTFNGAYTPLSYGEHYGALYALLAAPGSWNDTSFIASGIGNFSDMSFLTRLDARVRVLTYLDLAAWGTLYLGEEGELRPSISIPPVSYIPELENGLEVAPPRFELGVGATARF